jgi:hypothetical protein
MHWRARMTKLSEDSEFTVPLKNLIALIIATALAATAYFQINQELAHQSFQQDIIWGKVREHEDWIDTFRPPPEVLAAMAKQRELELLLNNLESRLEFIENGHNDGDFH